MVKFVAQKTSSRGISPWGVDDIEKMEKLPYLKPFVIEASAPRSVPQLRLWWGLCRRIAQAVGIADPEAVSDLLLIESGYHDTFKSKKYGIIYRAKSISFGSIEQSQFNEIFNRAIDVVYANWGIARKDVLKVVNDLLMPGVEEKQ